VNASGARESGEARVSGLTVYLDLNLNRSLDGSEPSRVSDASGTYDFGNLAAGGYSVRGLRFGMSVFTGAASAGALAVNLTSGVDRLAANLGLRLVSPVFPTRVTTNLFTTAYANSNTAYVYNVFRSLLNRDPSTAEVSYHVNALNSGYNRIDYATSIYNREEQLAYQVDQIYRTFLKRPADAAGLTFWADQLRRGLSPEWMIGLLVSANEYQSSRLSNASYIKGLYNDLLCREPTSADIAFWSNVLSGGRSRFDLAFQFASSPEAYTRAVKDVFVQYLHREATPADVNHWVNLLVTRKVSVSRMAILLIASTEFATRGVNAAG